MCEVQPISVLYTNGKRTHPLLYVYGSSLLKIFPTLPDSQSLGKSRCQRPDSWNAGW